MREKRTLTESDITKHTWGFEWDDVKQAAGELSQEEFGPDLETPTEGQHCFECGEIRDDIHPKSEWCLYCGANYAEAKESRRFLASVVDEVYQHWAIQLRLEYHYVIKTLRSVNPEFRAMWEEEANKAALKRRYGNG